ncbi:unnamed protein product [Adineta steineri]|uniref:RBR-type E3 ubiquitin transferase n=1 Tax=Adineta steineri TaxID=433720 RepID=A0A818IPT6_9BILA|nr:unnamed protein product [Adineta steineri]
MSAEHEDEILVLKSIFNDDFLSIGNQGDSYTFELIIRFDSLLNKIRLIHEESNASTELSHLPPIVLRITTKQTYPEANSPVYCILCDYLTDDQLLLLANQMDAVWESGEVIIYTWIELIKEYICHLSNEFILRSALSSIDDPRILSNYVKIGSKRIYEQLIEYDRIQNQLIFEQTLHSCPICLQEQSGKDCLQFEKCHHYACLSCLNFYATEYLSNSQQSKELTCYDCNSSLFLSELRRMFSDDKFLIKYQQRLLEQTVDMVWCPRCHHSIICIPSESTSGNHLSFVECHSCLYTFCRRCQETWHPQLQCPKEKLIQEFMNTPVEKQPPLKPIDIQKISLEIANIQMIEHCSKPCPSCGVRIEKNGGCQHMNCRACKIHFCWTCGWYGTYYSTHPCEQKAEKAQAALPYLLSDKIETLTNENDGRRIPKDIIKRIQKCPKENCRQIHLKIGTKNTLICEKCETNFCFLCGEAIYGKFHFSQYGCKEFTTI